jgi:hypothetical protein
MIDIFNNKEDAFPIGLCLFIDIYLEVRVKKNKIDTTKYKLITDFYDMPEDKRSIYCKSSHTIRSCGHEFIYSKGYITMVK